MAKVKQKTQKKKQKQKSAFQMADFIKNIRILLF